MSVTVCADFITIVFDVYGLPTPDALPGNLTACFLDGGRIRLLQPLDPETSFRSVSADHSSDYSLVRFKLYICKPITYQLVNYL